MGRAHHPAAGGRFSHTRNSVYLSAIFALCCVGYDSTHVSREGTNKPPLACCVVRRLPLASQLLAV